MKSEIEKIYMKKGKKMSQEIDQDRDYGDAQSAEAAEAWAMQNFTSAMSALVEQIDFKNYAQFERYIQLTSMAAFAKNDKKLNDHKVGGNLI